MAKVRDLCKDLNGITITSDEDAIACFFLDKRADIKALILPNAVILKSPKIQTEIALDDVISVDHDPKAHRIRVHARSGTLEIGPDFL